MTKIPREISNYTQNYLGDCYIKKPDYKISFFKNYNFWKKWESVANTFCSFFASKPLCLINIIIIIVSSNASYSSLCRYRIQERKKSLFARTIIPVFWTVYYSWKKKKKNEKKVISIQNKAIVLHQKIWNYLPSRNLFLNAYACIMGCSTTTTRGFFTWFTLVRQSVFWCVCRLLWLRFDIPCCSGLRTPQQSTSSAQSRRSKQHSAAYYYALLLLCIVALVWLAVALLQAHTSTQTSWSSQVRMFAFLLCLL